MTNKKEWIQRHIKDEFVRKAQHDGYVSRAAYKLIQIQQRDRIFKPNQIVLDLGAAPGGWSQVARQFVGKSGKIISLDILPLKISDDLVFIQGDINDAQVWQQLLTEIKQASATGKVDLVICDIAPNLSGNDSIDQPRSQQLVEMAFDCVKHVLLPGGGFLVKIFQGVGSEELLKSLRSAFKTVKIRKPKASRAKSREVYFLAQGFVGYND